MLFNPERREGAIEEAHAMDESLAISGFKTKTLEWKMDYHLFGQLDAQLDELIPDGLSLLVLSIMSHGAAGILTGSSDSKISISDILQVLKGNLPKQIPVVS